MREKILEILESCKGRGGYYGMSIDFWSIGEWLELLQEMESEGLVVLHRSSGGAGTKQGEILMVSRREK